MDTSDEDPPPNPPQALTSDIVYNMTPQLARAAVLVISQIGDYAVTLTLTFTSTLMRDEPSPEQLEGEEGEGEEKALHPCCSASSAVVALGVLLMSFLVAGRVMVLAELPGCREGNGACLAAWLQGG